MKNKIYIVTSPDGIDVFGEKIKAENLVKEGDSDRLCLYEVNIHNHKHKMLLYSVDGEVGIPK